jgi:anthranilate 1,2-dioxygenase large subunit
LLGGCRSWSRAIMTDRSPRSKTVAHRGALICLDNAGNGAKDFQCVYHAWRYDLRGNLQSVAFQRGVKGKGGMRPDFRVADYGPRKLRTTSLHGLVFGTFSD